MLYTEDYDDMAEHVELQERLRKSFYYGRTPTTDRPSLPMTELAVEFLHQAAPRELGKVDMYWASSVTRRAAVSPCSMMLGMMYIERLKHKNPEYLQQISSSELFLISMMVASKYLYDEGITEEVFNDEWAESAKMETEDVNQMEREFLGAIDWSLFTDPVDFWRALESMEEKIALAQGEENGWLTYMDLFTLSRNGDFRRTMSTVMAELLKVMLACSVAYTAGCLTLAASPHALSAAHDLSTRISVPAIPIPELPVLPDILPDITPEDENKTEELPKIDDLENQEIPDSRVLFGLPGFLTLTVLKETVLGMTGFSQWQTNSSDMEFKPCEMDDLDFNTGCTTCNGPRLHGRCVNRPNGNQGKRVFLDQITGRLVEQFHESSHNVGAVEQCKDYFWDKASVFSEKVQNSFSDVILGFQTTTFYPIAA